MKKLTKEKATKIFEKVAKENGVTLEEVLKEVKFAMLMGMKNQSPEVQAKWKEIPHDGNTATPEELLIYLSGQFIK